MDVYLRSYCTPFPLFQQSMKCTNFLKNADLYWKKADAEQKHALARFLFSNITVGDGKVLTVAYKPLIASLFVSGGGADGT